MENLKRYNYKLTNPTTYAIEMVESKSGEYVKFSDIKDILKTPTNKQMVQLPELEELQKAIPFPEDEQECAYFCAGLAEAHKFIARQQKHKSYVGCNNFSRRIVI